MILISNFDRTIKAHDDQRFNSHSSILKFTQFLTSINTQQAEKQASSSSKNVFLSLLYDCLCCDYYLKVLNFNENVWRVENVRREKNKNDKEEKKRSKKREKRKFILYIWTERQRWRRFPKDSLSLHSIRLAAITLASYKSKRNTHPFTRARYRIRTLEKLDLCRLLDMFDVDIGDSFIDFIRTITRRWKSRRIDPVR